MLHRRGARWHTLLFVAAAVVAVTELHKHGTAAAASLPEGLDSKPLIDQLLARKAYLAEHMQGEEWKQHVNKQLAARSSPMNQQGVLIVAGGRDMFANAAITLRVIRGHLKSSIPVEIVHYGPNELPPAEILSLFSALNVTSSSSSSSSAGGLVLGPVFITDALAVAPPEQAAALHRKLPEGFKSFPAKVYALTHVTRFKQVLLLDADSMPLVDPNLLFKVPMFQRTGSMFWPDLWYNAWVNDTIYTLVGDMKEPPWVGNKHHRLVDSGQILFDRIRHAEVLEYLWLLNSHHEWVYKHMHGDKDTFLMAFSMAGRRDKFTQVPCFTRDAMRDIPGHTHKFHHLGMIQSMPPAMLGAAMRAEARATSGANSGSVAHKRRLLLHVPPPPAIDTSSSRSSSSRLEHKQLQGLAAVPPAVVQQGLSDPTTTAQTRRLLHLDQLLPVQHTKDSSSSSSSRGIWQQWQQWVSRHRLLLQSDSSSNNDAADDDGFGDDDLGRSAGAAAAAGGGKGGPSSARRLQLKHVGVPVFFHRTSFNSKFFPDCLNADKIKTAYCEVEWVSVPLSNEQAGHSLKPHMFAWNDNQIDTNFYQQHCAQNATQHRMAFSRHLLHVTSSSSSSTSHTQQQRRRQLQVVGPSRRRRRPVIEQFGLPPEHKCDKLPINEDTMPIPVMRVQLFPYLQKVLQASYEAFKDVREKAGIKV